VLSPSNRGRDLLLKRHDYAAAGIPAHWIVDTKARSMTVLTLDPATTSYHEQMVVAAGRRWQAEHPFPITLDPADFC
jgi:Uma2 family endonuclease